MEEVKKTLAKYKKRIPTEVQPSGPPCGAASAASVDTRKRTSTVHQRHGDRSGGGDDVSADLRERTFAGNTTTSFVRFKHLKERGIVPNWPTLARWVRERDFPPGRLLGPNTRVWTETEIEVWINSRPTRREEFETAARAATEA
ncbi:MAG: AlpA family phage regulatory protein [Hyphomicrobiales bacterium]|nr:AlpA family phage regulatory protein [Hyphomicrobiales bacterium]